MNPFPTQLSRLSLTLLCLAAVPGAARAQDQNAVEEIKAIFRLVEKDLEDIDRLLLSFDPAGAATKMDAARKGIQKILDTPPPEGGKTGGEGEPEAGKTGGEGGGTGGSVKKVLEKAEAKQSAVVNGIQRILDKVPSGKGGKGQDQPKDKDQKGQGQEPKGQQRGHDAPDYQQQDQQQDQQQGEPKGNKQNPTSGTNQQAKTPPPEGSTQRANRDEIDRLWGELPEYQRMQMMKQGMPQVPARYQRYFDEFIRRSSKTGGK